MGLQGKTESVAIHSVFCYDYLETRIFKLEIITVI